MSAIQHSPIYTAPGRQSQATIPVAHPNTMAEDQSSVRDATAMPDLLCLPVFYLNFVSFRIASSSPATVPPINTATSALPSISECGRASVIPILPGNIHGPVRRLPQREVDIMCFLDRGDSRRPMDEPFANQAWQAEKSPN